MVSAWGSVSGMVVCFRRISAKCDFWVVCRYPSSLWEAGIDWFSWLKNFQIAFMVLAWNKKPREKLIVFFLELFPCWSVESVWIWRRICCFFWVMCIKHSSLHCYRKSFWKRIAVVPVCGSGARTTHSSLDLKILCDIPVLKLSFFCSRWLHSSKVKKFSPLSCERCVGLIIPVGIL